MYLNFGKYKGLSLEDVYEIDKLYIEWLYNNHDSDLIRIECMELLYPEPEEQNTTSKIEEIVLHCLTKAGYSETESRIFIRKLKSK